jgi:hypothetical protein
VVVVVADEEEFAAANGCESENRFTPLPSGSCAVPPGVPSVCQICPLPALKYSAPANGTNAPGVLLPPPEKVVRRVVPASLPSVR